MSLSSQVLQPSLQQQDRLTLITAKSKSYFLRDILPSIMSSSWPLPWELIRSSWPPKYCPLINMFGTVFCCVNSRRAAWYCAPLSAKLENMVTSWIIKKRVSYISVTCFLFYKNNYIFYKNKSRNFGGKSRTSEFWIK